MYFQGELKKDEKRRLAVSLVPRNEHIPLWPVSHCEDETTNQSTEITILTSNELVSYTVEKTAYSCNGIEHIDMRDIESAAF